MKKRKKRLPTKHTEKNEKREEKIGRKFGPLKGKASFKIKEGFKMTDEEFQNPKVKIKKRPIGLSKESFETPKSFFEPLPNEVLDSFERK